MTIKKTAGVTYFVSVEHYLNRDKNFLKHLPTATHVKRNTNDLLAVYSQELNVYGVLNHNTTTGVYSTKYDFILLEKRSPGNLGKFEFDIEKYFWKNSTFSNSIKKIILPEEGRRTELSKIEIYVSPNDFLSDTEKEIKKLMTPSYNSAVKFIQNFKTSYQSSFFYMIVQTL